MSVSSRWPLVTVRACARTSTACRSRHRERSSSPDSAPHVPPGRLTGSDAPKEPRKSRMRLGLARIAHRPRCRESTSHGRDPIGVPRISSVHTHSTPASPMKRRIEAYIATHAEACRGSQRYATRPRGSARPVRWNPPVSLRDPLARGGGRRGAYIFALPSSGERRYRREPQRFLDDSRPLTSADLSTPSTVRSHGLELVATQLRDIDESFFAAVRRADEAGCSIAPITVEGADALSRLGPARSDCRIDQIWLALSTPRARARRPRQPGVRRPTVGATRSGPTRHPTFEDVDAHERHRRGDGSAEQKIRLVTVLRTMSELAIHTCRWHWRRRARVPGRYGAGL